MLRFGDDPIVPGANTFGIPGNDRIAVFAVSSATQFIFFSSDADLKTSSGGKVHYRIFGTAPNRRMVVEWNKMEIPSGGNSDDNTFQLKLYESEIGSGSTGGVIEMVYGNMSISRNYSVRYRVGLEQDLKLAIFIQSTPLTIPYQKLQPMKTRMLDT